MGKREKHENLRLLGSRMEEKAVRFLEAEGYHILERNYYIRDAEADIIALDKKVLCFIEVKYRSDDRFGTAEEAVTVGKIKKLVKLARVYLMRHKEYAEREIRFDVVAMNGTDCHLIKRAFDAC